MGWRLRSNGTSNNSASHAPSSNRPLNSSASVVDLSQSFMQYSELETQTNNTDCQIPRRRRCGIQHGLSGRSNSIAHLPYFTIDSSNRLLVATLPS